MVSAGQTQEEKEADILREKFTAELETWKQNQSLDEKSLDSFFNFLKSILSMLQEYRQNIASVEQSIVRMA